MQLVDRNISTTVLDQHRDTVNELRRAWRSGTAQPDAKSAIEALGGMESLHKSIVLDLAYEEYCVRREAGDQIDCERFIGRFSRISRSLRRQICIHDAMSARGMLEADLLPDWPAVGDEISGFLLKEELGRGSFGRVFLAQEMQLRERQVVVKVAERGLHEAQMLAQVQHPGVVPVYSVATDAEWGLTALCMPFISRATLLDVIETIYEQDQHPTHASQIARATRSLNCSDDCPVALPEPEDSTKRGTFADAVTVFGYLAASALKATHEKGILHRDIKPSNILVDQFGCPMLIDFNLSSEPRTDIPLGGTLPYMAPEQLREFQEALRGKCGSTDVTAAADVFSLGVCLFELLYGVHPYSPVPLNVSNQELAEFMLSQQTVGPREGLAAESRVDKPLRDIITRCLAFDPARRPTTAELADSLQNTRSIGHRVRRMFKLYPRLAKATTALMSSSLLMAGTALVLQPSVSERQSRMAAEAVISGNYVDAITHLDELLRLNPDDLASRAARGEMRMRLAQYRNALEDLETVYKSSPTSGLASRIAWCHAKLRNDFVAAEWYERLVREFPDSARFHNNLGCVLTQDRQWLKAIEHFDRALELDDSLSVGYFNRAEATFQHALRSGSPTPASALLDLDRSDFHGLTGEGQILMCQMCATAQTSEEQRFLAALRRCEALQVPRGRLESDEILKERWQDSAASGILRRLPRVGRVSRPRRLVPPFQ